MSYASPSEIGHRLVLRRSYEGAVGCDQGVGFSAGSLSLRSMAENLLIGTRNSVSEDKADARLWAQTLVIEQTSALEEAEAELAAPLEYVPVLAPLARRAPDG